MKTHLKSSPSEVKHLPGLTISVGITSDEITTMPSTVSGISTEQSTILYYTTTLEDVATAVTTTLPDVNPQTGPTPAPKVTIPGMKYMHVTTPMSHLLSEIN